MNRSQGRVDMKKVAFLGEIAVSSLAMAFVSIAYAPPARAQDQAATGAAGKGDAGEGAGEIIVTGSRLGRTRFNSPTPVTEHGSAACQERVGPYVELSVVTIPL